ncbi:ESX secretion-associated protein EspG [Nocardia flavorosea]|uniref:ESX secretion-associated protein EspG n=1 Tax=Nocardia flavorosea TaxID=53429 RepID=A0A846YLY3_9NOCA|nr:ESX secretion-associated protein EspG [Nocardia flavorosea]NKY59833.1 ESX secretion-associated protein EspG [Nocardia flavorosea]
MFGDHAETGPVSVDLNVDAALALQRMAGIDSYPSVLAVLPNIYKIEDRDRVHAVVIEQLAAAGVVDGDRVHPLVEDWLNCLYRPDSELEMRILDNGAGDHEATMLRMSLARRGMDHVLAVRCDDHIVIQPVFAKGADHGVLSAAVKAALGEYPILDIDPFTADAAALAEVPADPETSRTVLRELGASPRTASALTRALGEVVRRAELVMTEHRDGGAGSIVSKASVGVLDTFSGRFVVTPSAAMDGEIWSTFQPGDDAAIKAGIDALIELLPSRSWFETSRTL